MKAYKQRFYHKSITSHLRLALSAGVMLAVGLSAGAESVTLNTRNRC